MKKFYYILGALAAAAAVCAIIAVLLRKLKVSLCIEGLDDGMLDDTGDDDITLSFDDDEDFYDDPEIRTILSED